MHRLNLPVSFPTRALPGLLAWLRQSRVSIKVFEAICGTPVTDVVLGAFVLSSAPLRVADVSRVSTCSIELLSAFHCLEQCSLGGQELGQSQDLSPLGNLPKLTDLLLCGDFFALDRLQHLTSLQLQDSVAKATDNCKFASVFQELTLEHSDLHGLHTRGLSACTSLIMLQLRESVLYDQNEDLQLPKNLSVMPTGIPLSSQLHTLHLVTDNDQTKSLAVNWIHELSSQRVLRTLV